MSKSTSQTPAFRIIVTAIALCATGIGIYTFTTQREPPIATASTAPAASTKIAAANNAWSANPMLPTKSTPGNASATPLTAAPEVHDRTANAPSALSKETLAAMEMPADFVPVSADGTTENAPFARIALDGTYSGREAITRLGDHLEPVAQWYGMSKTQFSELLLTDSSAHIDSKGRMVYVDQYIEQSAAALLPVTGKAEVTSGSSTPPFPVWDTFQLHTRPNSNRVLYMNFVGINGTIETPFHLKGKDGEFTLAEHAMMQRMWLHVAQDFRAFDVDLTTQPPVAAPGRLGAMIMITSRDATTGGYGPIGAFQSFVPGRITSWCFAKGLAYNERIIRECISHELGHNLGLYHQGVKNVSQYYGGHGSGVTSWAPIMGGEGGKNLTHWAKGEYLTASNQQDEYVAMSNHGLKPLADDHGDTISTATVLHQSSANGFNNLSGDGMIETPNDVDVFKFTAGPGSISIDTVVSEWGSDLDVGLRLRDKEGTVVATSDKSAPTLGKKLNYLSPTGGTYFLGVRGIGRGDPKTNGYSNYGSIGKYKITGTAYLP